MSEYIFGVVKTKISKATGKRLDRIAQRHGASFVGPVIIPGNDATGWFAGPNRGNPFDQKLSDAVLADVLAAGIKLFVA